MICNNNTGKSTIVQGQENSDAADALMMVMEQQLVDAGIAGVSIHKVCYSYQLVFVSDGTGEEIDPENLKA